MWGSIGDCRTHQHQGDQATAMSLMLPHPERCSWQWYPSWLVCPTAACQHLHITRKDGLIGSCDLEGVLTRTQKFDKISREVTTGLGTTFCSLEWAHATKRFIAIPVVVCPLCKISSVDEFLCYYNLALSLCAWWSWVEDLARCMQRQWPESMQKLMTLYTWQGGMRDSCCSSNKL